MKNQGKYRDKCKEYFYRFCKKFNKKRKFCEFKEYRIKKRNFAIEKFIGEKEGCYKGSLKQPSGRSKRLGFAILIGSKLNQWPYPVEGLCFPAGL